MDGDRLPFWRRRWFAALLILGSALPFLLPAFPPLVDVPGHMGRFAIALGPSPFLAQFYGVGPLPLGNLGADLLTLPLARLIGIELATKLVVIAIPPLLVAAMLCVMRAVHGRLPPTAPLALPLALTAPFLYGFTNFSLAMALALFTFAAWIALGRSGRTGLRTALMVPAGVIVFVAHVYGWGVLGLICFAAECARQRERGLGWPRAALTAAFHCLALAVPLLILLVWRGDTPGMTQNWFALRDKAYHFTAIFRDRWIWFDLVSLFVVVALLIFARDDRRLRWSRALVGGAFALLIAFMLLPQLLFGSGFADMRLAPYMLAMLVMALGLAPAGEGGFARRIALAATAFAAVRLIATTASMGIAAADQERRLAALDHVPPQSRVVSLVYHRCRAWALPRNDHLGSLAIVRRDSFANDQWALAGGTTVTVHYPAARPFDSDDSQQVAEADCGFSTIDAALARIPRAAFDALWLIDSPPGVAPAGWALVWSGEGSRLYRPVAQAGRRSTQP